MFAHWVHSLPRAVIFSQATAKHLALAHAEPEEGERLVHGRLGHDGGGLQAGEVDEFAGG